MGQNTACCSKNNASNQKEKDLGSLSSFHKKKNSNTSVEKTRTAKQSSAKYTTKAKSTSPIRAPSADKSTSPLRNQPKKASVDKKKKPEIQNVQRDVN